MVYLKYIQYFYLIAAILFTVDGFVQLNAAERNPWLSFFFAGIALFMFFFRRRFAKKYENPNKNK
ncbi:hypothetical protein ABH942_001400 [Flavobacterium sp. 28YEA47A]|uniref:hypothetical protein n=1 Tax=Flavobacterium sp. 28YEA47A TaxID=3156276 RepID=UPI0035185E9E